MASTHDSCVQVEEVRRDLGVRVVENGVLSHMYLDELGTRDRMSLRIDRFRCISDGRAARGLQLRRRQESPGGDGRALGTGQAVDQQDDRG